MFRLPISRVPRIEWLLLGFLLFSVLWRGGKSLETTWLLVGIACVLIVADGIRKQNTMSNEKLAGGNDTSVWLLGTGFLLWTVLSYFFSSTKNYGLDEVLRDSALVLIFLWTMRNAGGESGARFTHRFISTMTIASVLGALFGLLVYVMQPVNRFVGTFFDHRFHTDYWPNAWAQFVLLAWPMIVLWMRGKSAKMQVAGCGLLGIVMGTLLLSYSRGAMIAFGGQIFLLSVWALMRLIHENGCSLQVAKCTMALVKIGVIVVTALTLFFGANAVRGQFHSVQSIGEKITFTADEGASSVDERQQFWKQSVQMIAERPFFGWGPYSFRFVHQRLQTTVLATSDHPHNVFLKLAAERGIPAALMFFLLLLVVIAPYVRLLRLGGKDDHRQLTLSRNGLFLVAVFGVLAHNLIDFNLQFVGIALPFWMMLGALASTHTGGRTGKGIFMHTKFVHKLELVVAVVLLTVALREGGFLITSSLGRHAEEARNTEAALRWYDRSTAEWFSRDMHLSRALLTTTQTETDRAQEAMDTFLRLNAEDPRGWRLQGDIARLKGDAVAAVDAYAKAYELGRWNDLSITLALVEVLREEDESSLVSMKPHIDALLGSFVEAIVLNAHFVALSHNAEDAIALSALLAEQFPDSAPRYEVLAARADFAMRTERAKVTSRPAGYLW